MSKVRKKKYNETSVYEEAKKRIHRCYDLFDNIVVNFSGGKDSTAVLNMVIEVAKERNQLPVVAHFFDEEAIHPPTIEYVKRVWDRKEVDLKWFCLPVVHRNACSNVEPYWTCWDPAKQDVWVRPLPDEAITNHPVWPEGGGISFQQFSDEMFPMEMGTVCTLTGVRTQESFRRFKAVSIKKNDNYITTKASNGNTYTAHPIYDWSSEDVWIAVRKFQWDYNHTYDIMNKTKYFNKFLAQRVCPPFGEEPLRGLWMYAECFPEMWHKMLKRVPGVATAWRYANTELYGFGTIGKPEDCSWKQYLEHVIDTYPQKEKKEVVKNINALIKRHYDKTDDPIPQEDIHPLTGTSWSFLCKLAIKGDMKGRTGPTLEGKAIAAQQKLGIESYDEAKRIYGKKEPNK